MTHNSKNDVIPEARRVESLATDYCRAPAIPASAASDDDGDVLVYGENFSSGFSKKFCEKTKIVKKKFKNLDKGNNL